MKAMLFTVGISIIAVALAGASWIGLILMLEKSGIPFLQKITVYVSQMSFLGWLYFGLASIGFFLLLKKIFSIA